MVKVVVVVLILVVAVVIVVVVVVAVVIIVVIVLVVKVVVVNDDDDDDEVGVKNNKNQHQQEHDVHHYHQKDINKTKYIPKSSPRFTIKISSIISFSCGETANHGSSEGSVSEQLPPATLLVMTPSTTFCASVAALFDDDCTACPCSAQFLRLLP